jgi:D-alanine---D-serine ligase
MKKKVAIMFGGCSSEYEVSLVSATSVIRNINKNKYDVIMIGITKNGDFYLYNGDIDKIEKNEWLGSETCKKITISANRSDHGIIVLDTNEIISLDIVFPVLHGKNGEDGRLQGLLELAGIKYVGCDMTSSAICMDKYLAHELVSSSGLLSPISYLFDKNEDYKTIENKIAHLNYPLFVKPLKAGSSFGITKISSINDLKQAISEAFQYDDKIIIEENIDGFEVGCAVLGNNDLTIGEVDEIELKNSFFDYFEKYNLKTSKIHLPARISKEERNKIRETALEIYKILGCSGFARVDMFYTKDKKIVFNEVNTIPGCTSHSRYPSMLKEIGISFEEVIDRLIELGLER